jgi:hypothetical protein
MISECCIAQSAPLWTISNTCSILGTVGPSVHQQVGWSPGQRILNDAGAREPQHLLDPPVPVTARIEWENDGEEHIDTVAAGWSGQLVYVRVPDRRYRLTSVWLNAVDVKRR